MNLNRLDPYDPNQPDPPRLIRARPWRRPPVLVERAGLLAALARWLGRKLNWRRLYRAGVQEMRLDDRYHLGGPRWQ